MIEKNMPQNWLTCSNPQEWHDWLNAHHDSETEVWLQIKKVKSKEQGILLSEAVEEALCFGWIDGIMYSSDAQKFIIRMSPRRRGSLWSLINRNRAERMISEGRMTEAGMVAIREAKANGKWQTAYTSKRQPDEQQLRKR